MTPGLLCHIRSHVLVLARVRAHSQYAYSWTGTPFGDRVDAVGGKLVDLRAPIHFLLLERSILKTKTISRRRKGRHIFEMVVLSQLS